LQDFVGWDAAVAVAVYVAAFCHDPGAVQLIVAVDDPTPEGAPRAGEVRAAALVAPVPELVVRHGMPAAAVPAPSRSSPTVRAARLASPVDL
jgi:hypothetical protein